MVPLVTHPSSPVTSKDPAQQYRHLVMWCSQNPRVSEHRLTRRPRPSRTSDLHSGTYPSIPWLRAIESRGILMRMCLHAMSPKANLMPDGQDGSGRHAPGRRPSECPRASALRPPSAQSHMLRRNGHDGPGTTSSPSGTERSAHPSEYPTTGAHVFWRRPLTNRHPPEYAA